MFCKNCGKELSGNMYMCPDCGEPVLTSTYLNSYELQPLESKKHALVIIGFCCTIIAIALAVPYLTCNIAATNIVRYDSYSLPIDMDYAVAASVTMGIITNLVALVGLASSSAGWYLYRYNTNQKEKAFSLTGIIVCSVVTAVLIFCYCYCALL